MLRHACDLQVFVQIGAWISFVTVWRALISTVGSMVVGGPACELAWMFDAGAGACFGGFTARNKPAVYIV